MNTEEVIHKILESKSPVELFGSLQSWKDTYRQYLTQVHPDKCQLPMAQEAMTKLNGYKDDFIKGKKHKDDAGVVTYKLNGVEIIGDQALLRKSLENFNILKQCSDPRFDFFKKYLPINMSLLSDNELEVNLSERAIPISALPTPLPAEHATWILNRMIEFSAGLNQIGYVHCGINPESVYVVPETHGIVIVSFYHLCKVNGRLKTISSKYANFYPQDILQHKTATSNIDTDLAKRSCIYMLGDKSGSGVKLRKDKNTAPELLNFLQKSSLSTYGVGQEYLALLKKLFVKKQFLILNA
jgi:hypothetical protein